MGIKFKAGGGLLVLLAASVAFPSVASADTPTPVYQTPAETIENAYFRHDRNFYENGSPQRTLDSLVGTGKSYRDSFPENEIAADAELVNGVYRDMLAQQSTNDPYLRTPDLPNPYDTSLLQSPRYNTNKLKIGTEYRFEIIQPR
ncbi:MAG TPA: hypothetical protein VK203_13700 [Nostocaceae cyanobacterium]|nr:hypothetical protein [Nostocaceae cyanobacterium]